MDPFETRLADLIHAHTAPADRPVDAVAMARAAIAAGSARGSWIGSIRFIGNQRRAWLLALVAVGLLAVLAVAIIGSRPTTSEPTIETIVYSDPKTGLVLEDPPGSTPRVIVSAGGPSGEMPPCFTSDVVAGRSACWSSVAVSPSGRYLALHAGAASVTSILTVDGREVSHVYDGQEGTARWSPVEDVMAINHGVELHIVDSGGQTTKRIPLPFDIEGVHGWSPDGRHVLVRAMDAFDLWAVDVVSGASTRLTDTPTVHEHESDWSPDGSLIAYTADCGDAWTPNGPCPSSIWTVRPDGSDRRRMTPEDGFVSMGPTWAPDGRHLAYTRWPSVHQGNVADGFVYVIDADGSNPRRITTFDTGVASVMAWSPDGSTIVVANVRLDGAGGVETADTWIMGADGSNPRVLVPGTIYVDQVWVSSDEHPAPDTSPRH
jgi:dipeptidyl aminopeptidase/acylaminoacyl peptidase